MTAQKRKNIFTIIGSIAGILIIYFLFQHMRYVTTDNAQIEAHWVMLAPKVNGYILKVNVEEGQKVKAGDVLVEIDARDYENSLNSSQSTMISVDARKKEAEKNYRRITQLFAEGAVSQQQLDNATSSYSEVKARYDSLMAQFKQAELNLENAKIKAPFDGYIAKKSVEVGQLASPGIPLIGFVSSTERWVTANFKETEIEDIKLNAHVSVDVDAISHGDFEGEVEAISSATGATFSLLPPDNATGNFTKVVQRVPVKIKLNNLTEKDIELLRNGLSAMVKVRR